MTEKRESTELGKKLIGVKEVSETTGLPASWIYSQAAAGRIPHLKLGKYLKFRPQEIAAWLETHRRGGNSQGAGANRD